MTFKTEYKRMMNKNMWQLTIFEFTWMFLTMPVWCTWYQLDTEYFEKIKKRQ